MSHEIETCLFHEDEKQRTFLLEVCAAVSAKHKAFDCQLNNDSPQIRVIVRCNGKALLDLVKALDHFGLLP